MVAEGFPSRDQGILKRGFKIMNIGIISDTHDHLVKIGEAVKIFNEKQVDAVIHCGDFIAPFAIKPFKNLPCPFYAVFGNNDGERKGLLKAMREIDGELRDSPHVFNLDEKIIYVCHEPVKEFDIRRLESRPDFILFGHTHEPERTKVAGVPAINPGEACGWLSGRGTAGLLNIRSGEYTGISL